MGSETEIHTGHHTTAANLGFPQRFAGLSEHRRHNPALVSCENNPSALRIFTDHRPCAVVIVRAVILGAIHGINILTGSVPDITKARLANPHRPTRGFIQRDDGIAGRRPFSRIVIAGGDVEVLRIHGHAGPDRHTAGPILRGARGVDAVLFRRGNEMPTPQFFAGSCIERHDRSSKGTTGVTGGDRRALLQRGDRHIEHALG